LTQVPPQFTCPLGHETEQLPAAQTWPEAQTVPPLAPWQLPEAPQLSRLVCGLTQAPPQLIWPPGQDTWHVPPLQTLPVVHAVPALPPALPTPHPAVAPQLARLVCGSTQTPPQLTWLPGHDTWQTPLPQTLPAPQAVPALPPPSVEPQPAVAPQYVRSLLGSTQTPPQLTWPLAHETWHAPLLHTLPAPQATPQAPQLRRSFWKLTQIFGPASPPQVPRPALHVRPHVPAEHTWPVAHLVSQAPQLAGSACVSLQLLLQLVVPPPQFAAHAPFEQTSPVAQVFPHTPQLEGDDWRSTQAAPHVDCPVAHPPPSEMVASTVASEAVVLPSPVAGSLVSTDASETGVSFVVPLQAGRANMPTTAEMVVHRANQLHPWFRNMLFLPLY
jgi:hypothetical protein